MKTALKRSDPDFDNWSVKFNGELLQHATIVSADAATGSVTRNTITGDGETTDQEETLSGTVRIIERNEAVRAKEPADVRVVQKGVAAKSAPKTEEPAPAPAAEDAPEDTGKAGGLKIKGK